MLPQIVPPIEAPCDESKPLTINEAVIAALTPRIYSVSRQELERLHHSKLQCRYLEIDFEDDR